MNSTPGNSLTADTGSSLSLRLNNLQFAWLCELGIQRALLLATPITAHKVSVFASHTVTLTSKLTSKLVGSEDIDATHQYSSVPASNMPVSSPMDIPKRLELKSKHGPYARIPGSIEQAPLTDLRSMVAKCEGCSLSLTRCHTVFGAGAGNATWMVVGEAPGEQEDLQGQPFVGKSGQLLTQMLHAVGIDRRTDVFITNVVKCRPPGNRNPKPEEISQCRPFLMRQIEVVAPQRLLVLGRYAAQVLVGNNVTLNALRGKIHIFTGNSGRQIPMIVSYHPAYLLRSPQEKAKAWSDLKLATEGIALKTAAK